VDSKVAKATSTSKYQKIENFTRIAVSDERQEGWSCQKARRSRKGLSRIAYSNEDRNSPSKSKS
jgi:hypothetical protein